MTRLALQILWPAFLMAGVLEVAVFALVDPSDLHWLNGAPLGVSRQAVYTLAFLLFWVVIAIASAVTTLLTQPERANHPPD
jgi:ABC-type Mn2+/Zn2+ transport system permease subunit